MRRHQFFLRILLILLPLHFLVLGFTKINAFDYIRNENIRRTLYVILGVVGVYIMFRRDFFLPFLGETVMPTAINESKQNPEKITLTKLPPNVTVVAWATKENTDNTPFKDPWAAYGDYSNYDTVQSNDKGEAIVELILPSEYHVPGKTLKKHVHYRFEISKGMFSRVHTHFL